MAFAPKPFVVEDLYEHQSILSVTGGTAHRTFVFSVSRILESSDTYRSTLWRCTADDDMPERLTDPAFDASSPRLDPDGKRVAFLSRRGGQRRQVHVLPLEGGEASALTSTEHELEAIHDWSPDGERLLVTAKVRWEEDLGGESSDDPKQDKDRPQLVRFLPYKLDGSGIVLGRRTQLFSVDAGSGELTLVMGGDFDVDDGAWSPDGRRLAIVRGSDGRQRQDSALWIADADGRNARRATEALAAVKRFAWSPDGKWIAIAAGKESGDAATLLWLLDATDGSLRQLGDDDFELDGPASLQWHPDGRRLAVVAIRKGLQPVVVFDVVDGGEPLVLGSGLRHALKLGHCGPDRLAIVYATMRKPEEVYTIAWDGTDERRHGAFNRGWFARRARPHVSKRRFRVPGGDGRIEHVEAWLLRPDGDGPFPLLVDLHGGPHSHVLVDYPAHVYQYALLGLGWMVLAPNAVGSSGYGKEFRERLRGRWGELDLPQVLEMVGTLQREGLADQRVACMGKSYGGFLSAWSVGHCDTFRAAVVSAPVADVESHAGTSDSGFYVTPWMMAGELNESRDKYLHLSPTTYCDNVRTPTLVLQGEDDQRCPLGQSEEFFAGLVRCSGAESMMVVYPGGSHGMAKSGKPSHRVDYHQRIVDWVQKAADPGHDA